MSLTHDMRKAAEAAFHGRPKHLNWTQQAQQIYDGILQAKHGSVQPSLASAFTSKSLQAWHIHYPDTEEDTLMLFPAQADLTFILHVVKAVAGTRPFTMRALKQGHFQIQLPSGRTISALYAHDSRMIDQDGMVRPRPLPSRPPQSPSSCRLSMTPPLLHLIYRMCIIAETIHIRRETPCVPIS